MPTMPYSSASATRITRPMSRCEAAAEPNGVPLASSMASASAEADQGLGPNVSSRKIFAVRSTSVRMVG